MGYPNNERQGNLIQPASGCLGMSAKSEKKEGVWEFMQILICENYQKSSAKDVASVIQNRVQIYVNENR